MSRAGGPARVISRPAASTPSNYANISVDSLAHQRSFHPSEDQVSQPAVQHLPSGQSPRGTQVTSPSRINILPRTKPQTVYHLSETHYVIIPSLAGKAEYCNKQVCLSVRSCYRSCRYPHVQTSPNCWCMLPVIWFGPTLMALRYVMHFRFCG